MTDNKLKDFAIRVLSEYISNEDLDTFISQHSVEVSTIKDDKSMNQNISYVFCLESWNRESDLNKKPNVLVIDPNKIPSFFVIKASKTKTHHHEFSSEHSTNEHVLTIQSKDLSKVQSREGTSTQKSLDKKNAKNQKNVEKEIKAFLKRFRKHYVFKTNDCWHI